jgi:predicted RNase H-like nuclease (RuvC/YqgF family)
MRVSPWRKSERRMVTKMDDLRAKPILPGPFPDALDNLINRARAAMLVASEMEAAEANLRSTQADLNSILAEISRVKQTILSEETAFETERRTGIVAEAVDPDDLSRLSREIEEKRAEAVRLQNEVAAEHKRCEKLAKDCAKLEKMLG